MGLLFNMPLDGAPGETTAQDYGPFSNNGNLSGGVDFVTGISPNKTNCANFDGTGTVSAPERVINAVNNFTLSAWVNTEQTALGIYAQWDEDTTAAETFEISQGQWHPIAAVKEGGEIRVYIDNKHAGTITAGEKVTGLAFTQGGTTEHATGKIYGVKIFDYALKYDEIEMAAATTSALGYQLDGVNIRDTYGVYISDSDGLLDRPKIKTPQTVDWSDEHGTIVDLKNVKLSDRDITLKCFIYADTKLAFSVKAANFLQALEGGLHRLQVDIDSTKPLVYDIYCKDTVSIDKRWSDGLMVGEFTIKLTEPRPVKRVVRFEATAENNLKAEIHILETDPQLYTFSWGDNSDLEEEKGTNYYIRHTYSAAGTYYIIIAGNISSNLETGTNGVVIWEKI